MMSEEKEGLPAAAGRPTYATIDINPRFCARRLRVDLAVPD